LTVSRLDRPRALLLAILVACATLPYLNIFFNGFVYDDDTQLLRNPYVRSFQHLKEIFTTNVWSFQGPTVTNYYRPMMTLGFQLCYRVFGMQAYGFHLVSLLLHVIVVCLVFLLTERLTGDRVWAFVASAFFALHPIHTESVAWIAAVTDLELTFFYLLTFGLYLAMARPGGGRSNPLLAAMGGTFLLALLSKEQAMTLPALATVYEHFCREDRAETRTSQKLARYGLLWLLDLAYLLFRIHLLGGLAPNEKFGKLTPLQIVLSAIALVARYVGKLLWPVRLCAFYVFHPSVSLLDWRVLVGLAILLALAGLVLTYGRSRERSLRLAGFGIVWFLATLAPVLNAHWVGDNVFTERYLYLPSVGVAWLVGLGASRLWSRSGAQPERRRALALAGVALGGLYAARIVIRNGDWNNDIVLYNQTLKLSPDSYVILYNLGSVYWHRGDSDQADHLWRQALAAAPDNTSLLYNLGLMASQRKHFAEAAELFRRAVQQSPSLPDPHVDLGKAYLQMGLRDQAELQFRAAVALSPNASRARNELGQLLFASGRSKEAEEQFRASARVKPNVLAYDYLGLLSMRRGDVGEAARDFQAALSLSASDSYAHFGLGDISLLAGHKAEALSHYQAGLRQDPTNAEVLAAVRKLRQQMSGAAP
jgi:tetratricopeptide (TPR) repeat protein